MCSLRSVTALIGGKAGSLGATTLTAPAVRTTSGAAGARDVGYFFW